MKNGYEEKQEKRISFVAKHYREGAMDADRAWKQFAEKNEIKKQKRSVFHYWQAIAAAVLVCVALSTWYFMGYEEDKWLVVTTAPGQVKNVFLPDSSMVAMAGSSTIKYNLMAFEKGNRDVEMEGKAFFQVRRDEDSPFTVISTKTIVTVLGTSFQLSEKDGETDLYVNSGKVAFSLIDDDDVELVLTAGMSAKYEDVKGIQFVESADHENILSWHTKELHFNNTSLENVIRNLSDHYQVQIVNRIEEGDKYLTASFNDLPLDEVLLIINQTLDVHLVAEP